MGEVCCYNITMKYTLPKRRASMARKDPKHTEIYKEVKRLRAKLYKAKKNCTRQRQQQPQYGSRRY